MNAKLIAALGAGATILAVSQTATAGVSVGLAVGAPVPVYAAPAPVYAAPAYVGWRDDDRRWAYHRWEEHRWDEHRWGHDRRWDDRDRDYGYRRW
ncbi:hypothetical protein [Paraburkholderia pallida]|uniref:PXPV repeat-containing protein n=1 Tax=Paraburkholderia pallida TaxID=2547399 RepID=A0A4P7CPF9_9BURK|nr:hypothetical protein [Paraburkholderia pallida]QBQ96051.1 hypothetical protein E1956_01880 [Paraburkholderia pallida]